jgi:16S rRNA (cytidine1402-2'-O)-methyltransferase
MPGTLYLVATPIGNLKDITHRAVEVLGSVDLIACEDTRHTRKLLNHLGISTRTVSYHQHNETTRAAELAAKLSEGGSIAVVSDAGTPGISDPGAQIVAAAIGVGATVVPVPGPAAFVSAVTASGLPADEFYFAGFLPSKKADRVKKLMSLAQLPATIVFYEAPHRILKTLADAVEALGDRDAAVARELTKLHEEFVRGSLSELVKHFSAEPPRGEMVLVIAAARSESRVEPPTVTVAERVAELEASGLDRKSALKAAAREFGIGKSEAYRILQDQKNR